MGLAVVADDFALCAWSGLGSVVRGRLLERALAPPQLTDARSSEHRQPLPTVVRRVARYTPHDRLDRFKRHLALRGHLDRVVDFFFDWRRRVSFSNNGADVLLQ